MANTLPNRILKSTCRWLAGSAAQLSSENRREIRHALHLLSGIDEIRITSRTFKRVQLHRNNRHYRLLLHVCRLLHELYLPNQQSGTHRFRHLIDEKTIMHAVFESFVRRFAERHCPEAKVSAMQIQWNGQWSDDVDRVLPVMKTDVTLVRNDRKTILDSKYYKNALVTNRDRHTLHSSHLYQLTAYLQNKSRDEGWGDVKGILLYPAVDHHLNLKFSLLGHRIEIHSIDLDQEWPQIHNRLLDVLV